MFSLLPGYTFVAHDPSRETGEEVAGGPLGRGLVVRIPGQADGAGGSYVHQGTLIFPYCA